MATTQTENRIENDRTHWNSPESQQRSLQNLRPFTSERRPQHPGRRKMGELERLLRSAGRKKVSGDPQGRNFLQLAIHRLYMSACKGNVEATKVILERLYGKVMSGEELEQALGNTPIVVQVMTGVPRHPEYDFSRLSPALQAELPEHMRPKPHGK